MKCCPDRQDTLCLDVYGELPPNERQAWKRHLEACNGCQEERQRLIRLLQRVKASMPAPLLPEGKAGELAACVTRELKPGRTKTWWQKRQLGLRSRFIPALAAACLLIVALGWFSLRQLQGPSTVPTVLDPKAEEQMIVKDLDVIDNLELLEEMDALQKLLKVVDHRDVM